MTGLLAVVAEARVQPVHGPSRRSGFSSQVRDLGTFLLASVVHRHDAVGVEESVSSSLVQSSVQCLPKYAVVWIDSCRCEGTCHMGQLWQHRRMSGIARKLLSSIQKYSPTTHPDFDFCFVASKGVLI